MSGRRKNKLLKTETDPDDDRGQFLCDGHSVLHPFRDRHCGHNHVRGIQIGQSCQIFSAMGSRHSRFLPFIGFSALLHLNGKATRALQANGMRVRLMGAEPNDLEKIRPKVTSRGGC